MKQQIKGENNQIYLQTHQEEFILLGCFSSNEELVMSAVSILDKPAKCSGLIKKKTTKFKSNIVIFSDPF